MSLQYQPLSQLAKIYSFGYSQNVRKMVLFIIPGLGCLIGSIYVFFLFLERIETSLAIVLFVAALLLAGAGSTLMIFASKQNGIGSEQAKPVSDTASQEGLADVLKKNAEIAKQWNKTSGTLDKMRMIQISAKAKDEDTQ